MTSDELFVNLQKTLHKEFAKDKEMVNNFKILFSHLDYTDRPLFDNLKIIKECWERLKKDPIFQKEIELKIGKKKISEELLAYFQSK